MNTKSKAKRLGIRILLFLRIKREKMPLRSLMPYYINPQLDRQFKLINNQMFFKNRPSVFLFRISLLRTIHQVGTNSFMDFYNTNKAAVNPRNHEQYNRWMRDMIFQEFEVRTNSNLNNMVSITQGNTKPLRINHLEFQIGLLDDIYKKYQIKDITEVGSIGLNNVKTPKKKTNRKSRTQELGIMLLKKEKIYLLELLLDSSEVGEDTKADTINKILTLLKETPVKNPTSNLSTTEFGTTQLKGLIQKIQKYGSKFIEEKLENKK